MGRPQKEIVGYRAAHLRIAKDRGPAVEFDCVCGQHAAQEWALMHGTPDLLWQYDKAYSLDVMAYQPMSIACHRRYDGNLPPKRGGGSR